MFHRITHGTMDLVGYLCRGTNRLTDTRLGDGNVQPIQGCQGIIQGVCPSAGLKTETA